jgi:hypothetical protein
LVELSLVTTALLASSTEIVTAGVIVDPAAVLVGCCVNTSFVAAPEARVAACVLLVAVQERHLTVTE